MGNSEEYFSSKTVLITGASSGIGAEFARQLHALGCNVIILARRQEQLIALCSELNKRRQNSASYWRADLCSLHDNDGQFGLHSICRLIEESRIDILINNAGIGSFGEFDRIPLRMESAIIALNIEATVRIAHSVLPQMKRRRSGHYVSVSSIAGIEPLPYMATYSASKAFNLFHSLAIRKELADYNIGVTIVCPGPVETEFFGVAQLAVESPNLHRENVTTVVKQSIRAILRNKAVVFPGTRAKLISFAVRLLPYAVTGYFTKRFLSRLLPHQPTIGS